MDRALTRETALALSAALGEPDWLRDRRLAAVEQFEQTPYPDTLSDEDWRRTDLRRYKIDDLARPIIPNGQAGPAATPADDLAGTIEFANGVAGAPWLAPELAAAGVLLCPLAEAIARHPDLLRRWLLTDVVKPDEGKFALLHAGFLNAGLLCFVPSGVKVEQAILARVGLEGGTLAHHTLIVVEDDAELAFVEEYHAAGSEQAISVPVTEIVVGERARVVYAGLQSLGDKALEFGVKRALVGREAHLTLCATHLGGKLNKEFIGATLAEPGGQADVVGISFPAAGQHLDQTTVQDHVAPHCESNLRFLAAVGDKGRSIFRGVVNVHPSAQQTDAYQKNDTLLLGDEARADSMPVLEILADDVKCSHGASLAHLDTESLFYLRSRGLPLPLAQRLVVEGFFESVIEQIPAESVRQRLRSAVAARIDRQAQAHGGLL